MSLNRNFNVIQLRSRLTSNNKCYSILIPILHSAIISVMAFSFSFRVYIMHQ